MTTGFDLVIGFIDFQFGTAWRKAGREGEREEGTGWLWERDWTPKVNYSRSREKARMFKRSFDHLCVPAVSPTL